MSEAWPENLDAFSAAAIFHPISAYLGKEVIWRPNAAGADSH